MPKYKVGDHVLVKLPGGRFVETTIKAVVETTVGVRLQLSFREETALIWSLILAYDLMQYCESVQHSAK